MKNWNSKVMNDLCKNFDEVLQKSVKLTNLVASEKSSLIHENMVVN